MTVGAVAAIALSLDLVFSGHAPAGLVVAVRVVSLCVLLGLSSFSLAALCRLPSVNELGTIVFFALVLFFVDCTVLSIIGELSLEAIVSLQIIQSGLLLSIAHYARVPLSFRINTDRETAAYTALIVMVALGVAFWLRASAGFVSQVDADIVKEALRTQYIIDEGGFRAIFLGSGISIRPILADDLLAGLSIIGGIGAYEFAWAGTFLTIPLLALGTLWLGRWLFDNLTGAVGGLLVLAFCGYFYFEGPEYVLPETVTLELLLLGLPLLVTLLETQSTRRRVAALILLLFSVSGYFYGVVILLPVITGMALTRRRTALIALSTLLLATALWVNGLLIGSAATVFSWIQEIQLWQGMYTLVGLALGISGAYLLMKREGRSQVLGLYVFFIFLVSMVGIPEADRLQYWVSPFVAIAAAYSCVYISKSIAQGNRGVQLFTFAILAFLTPFLVAPNSDWVHASEPFAPWSGTPYVYNTPDETSAAHWILSHYGSNAFIISDLDTSVIIQSICGCQGVWNPINFLNNTALAIAIYSTLSGNSATAITKVDRTAAKVPMIAVVSTRTPSSLEAYNRLVSSNGTSSLDSLRVYVPLNTTTGEATVVESLEKQGFGLAASFNSVEVLTTQGAS